uniref:Mur ligase family protein n=1 Tax=Eggerthella sinensis TaxID=242230 RepID=UPI0022E09B64
MTSWARPCATAPSRRSSCSRLDEATSCSPTSWAPAVIEVPDTAHAVADIAGAWRGHLHGRVIALTGSTGKTTTKNLVRDVLASTLSVVATAGNQNNELGVPKTLLNAEQDTQAVVVEMGMRGLGQLADLCDYVRPDWGLVVNVGESHIELLGSCENIARAKAELLCGAAGGHGPRVRERRRRFRAVRARACAPRRAPRGNGAVRRVGVRASTRAAWKRCCSTGRGDAAARR